MFTGLKESIIQRNKIQKSTGMVREMMRKRSAICWLILLVLCLSAAPGMGEEKYTLPIDFSPGMPIREEFFVSDLEYEDPTLKVKITEGQLNSCDYWIADIEIADPSQLRTISADGFDSNGLAPPERMAKHMNAVLAFNGDYFSYKGRDVVIRQGTTYLNRILTPYRDILAIDEDGNFNAFFKPDKDDIGETVNGKKIINAFSFGPYLIHEGKNWWNGASDESATPEEKCQRIAFCQIGPLKYRVVCCGPLDGQIYGVGKGMTLDDFRWFLRKMGDIQEAYNLDGGDSTFMIFNGKKINFPENPNARDGKNNREGLPDLIYFASAYPGDN